MGQQKNAEGLAWQISVWDRMAPVYIREIDTRFEPIVERVVQWADLKSGQHVLDLGTGTGSVALRAAEAVAPNGRVTAVDISPDMLAVAKRRAASAEANITFVEGRAEAIPADAESIDAIKSQTNSTHMRCEKARAYPIQALRAFEANAKRGSTFGPLKSEHFNGGGSAILTQIGTRAGKR
jgi:SAM-dependent methyltransferase